MTDNSKWNSILKFFCLVEGKDGPMQMEAELSRFQNVSIYVYVDKFIISAKLSTPTRLTIFL